MFPPSPEPSSGDNVNTVPKHAKLSDESLSEELTEPRTDSVRKVHFPPDTPQGTDSSQAAETTSSADNSFSSVGRGLLDMISKVNPMKLIRRQKPEDTEISFTHFIQALQSVGVEKCLSTKRGYTLTTPARRPQRRSLDSEYSEYLS